MENQIKNGRTYRFLPAYILLFLAMEDLYGSALLNVFRTKLPNYSVDSAVIYRKLQDLEKDGSLTSYWETENPGPATRWYRITERGFCQLAEFKSEIEKRIKNLEFFLASYDKLPRKKS